MHIINKTLFFIGSVFWATSCTNSSDFQQALLDPSNSTLEFVELYRDNFDVSNIGIRGNQSWRARVDSREMAGTVAKNQAENLLINNGLLDITFKKEIDLSGNSYYSGGGVISKKQFGYGYYEIKMKVYTGSYGFHQSFWMSNPIHDLNGFEFDSRLTGYSVLYPSCFNHLIKDGVQDEIFEFNYARPKNEIAISGGPGSFDNYKDPTNSSTSTWLVFGYDWRPDGVTMYLDGTVYGTINTIGSKGTEYNSLYSPASVWLTGVPLKIYPLTDIVDPPVGAKMQIDYFTYAAKKYPGVNILGDPSFDNSNANSAGVFNSSCWSSSPFGKYPSAAASASVVNIDNSKVLLHSNNLNDYQVNSCQKLDYIRNGHYSLNSLIKCSAHSYPDGFTISILNPDNSVIVKHSISDSYLNDWNPVSISNFEITQNGIKVLIRSNAKKGEWVQVDKIELFNIN